MTTLHTMLKYSHCLTRSMIYIQTSFLERSGCYPPRNHNYPKKGATKVLRNLGGGNTPTFLQKLTPDIIGTWLLILCFMKPSRCRAILLQKSTQSIFQQLPKYWKQNLYVPKHSHRGLLVISSANKNYHIPMMHHRIVII